MLSHALWKSSFNSDPAIAGRSLSVNGESYSVIGVMPEGLQFPIQAEPVELWANLARDAEEADGGPPLTVQRGNHFLSSIARLKSEIPIEQAEAQLVDIAAGLEQQFPDTNTGFSVRLETLSEQLTGDVKEPLLVIFLAVGLVLLIACANVANLLLARAVNRRREIAVRAALGASRWRLIRQFLTESTLLALLGGVVGVMLAAFGSSALVAVTPRGIPRMTEASVDLTALFFALGLATLTGVIMGLVPALQTSRLDLHGALKEGGRGSSKGKTHARVRGTLVVVEIALAMLVLTVAGLLINSFVRLMKVNPGFNPNQLLTMRLSFPDGLFADPQRITIFQGRLMNALESVPGVSAFSTVSPLPMSGANFGVGFNIEGRPNASPRPYPYSTRLFLVGSDYFRTMGIALKDGRDYTPRDTAQSPPVVIINEALARRHFGDENPIGKRINPSIGMDGDPLMREIVGVASDARSRNLSTAPEPEVYLHIPQMPALGSMTVLMRAQTDPQHLIGAAREEIAKLDSSIPIYDVKTFDWYLDDTVAQQRFNGLLVGIFAAIALLLTAIGLYGVIAYSVSQRTNEIGVRMALGAKPRDVMRLVLGQGMKLTVIGVGAGIAASVILTKYIASLLYDVTPTDLATFVGISLLLSAVALLACYIPARRATRVDPLEALRCE